MKLNKAPSTSLLLASSVFLTACAGAGILTGVAMNVGRSLLADTAQKNFGVDYSSHVNQMMDTLFATATGRAAPVDAGVSEDEPVEPVEVDAVDPIDMAESSEPQEPLEPTEPAPPAIELEVAVLREVIDEGRPVPVPLEDGAIIRDGIGRNEQGDNLKIRIRANVDCYVYAMWVDATAWTTPVFPQGSDFGFSNPVRGGREYFVPDGSDWFYLDDYRGVETLYVVASHEPMNELDDVLRDLSGYERTFLADIEQPTLLAEATEVTRGIAGSRLGSSFDVTASDGAEHMVPSQVYLGNLEEGGLVVTRWFRHE